MCYDSVIHKLLDEQQGGSEQLARTRLNDGSFPLHRALQKGLSFADGVDRISSVRHALAVPDSETILVPCLLAAVGEGARVNTVFGLTMKSPNLIADLISHRSKSEPSRIDLLCWSRLYDGSGIGVGSLSKSVEEV
jgi:hypothetical protein